MTGPDRVGEARADWEKRLGPRGAAARGRPAVAALAAPAAVHAITGKGQVTVSWDPVPGAAGYLVHRADSPDGPFRPVDHGGGDVLAVPSGPYADPVADGHAPGYYAVAAVVGPDDAGPLSRPAAAMTGRVHTGRVTVAVGADLLRELPRPWEPMIGSEHLSHLLRTDRIGGRVIGEELREALSISREAFGVQAVRAHAILGDDLAVYREDGAGGAVHDFSGVDRVYDQLLGLGLRPVVELSFMPRSLARDPVRTVFSYDAVISPPSDWDRWAALVHGLVSHLITRHGLAEVRDHWSFEVWNEPNLEVFWSGNRDEYFRLYDVTASAVRAVNPGLRVGGPASAAAGWIEEFLSHLDASGAPLDFLSTHAYGNAPLDLRPALQRHGRGGVPVWWTEWGATPTHFNEVGDTVFAAAFLLSGMRSALGRVEALSHWVASDHFEELGMPSELFHGGFGLLSVGNLRKPRFWALALLARLGRRGSAELGVQVSGDGAQGLVEAIATKGGDGRIAVLIWNSALDQSRMHGDPLLAREISLRVAARAGSAYTVTHYRIDAAHSNIVATWERIRDGRNWPDDGQWDALRAVNTLDELGPPATHEAGEEGLALGFTLPMPGVSYLELAPGPPGALTRLTGQERELKSLCLEIRPGRCPCGSAKRHRRRKSLARSPR
ncbi:MAG TPA: hypothetical protein VG253_17835 [Streptosporangiaceae bacterium]|nr:hypothetical protein [Streptosporangiaceae bacterium]